MLGDVGDGHEMWWWMMKRVWWREWNEERSEDVKELWGGGGVGWLGWRCREIGYYHKLGAPYNEILAHYNEILVH